MKYDIILMDINMPEMDGLEATRRIRSLGTPEGEQVPIISITANTDPDEIKIYTAAGMTDHVGKPIDYDEVVQKIKKYIKE
jgi:CheY-like chemotaxis protein